MEILKIVRKKRLNYVRQFKVGELDKTRFSAKFSTHNFNDDFIIYVKCNFDGTLDLRGKKQEYRIIVPDKNIKDIK